MSAGAIRSNFAANPSLASDDRAACVLDSTLAAPLTTQRNFTLGTTSVSSVVPRDWWGRWVRITPHGSTLYYFFSLVTGQTCAAPPAATDAGASAATAGEGPGADNVTVEVRIPIPSAAQGDVWFVRLGGTNTQSVQMVLADGTVGTTGG